MTHTYRPVRTRSRRIRKTPLPENIDLLPDGRIMYLRYNKNPIAKSARPYIAADDETSCPAYIPPLPDQIWRKYPVLNPADLLRLPKTGTKPTAQTRLSELADWLAVMYRLAETASAEPGQQHTGCQPADLRAARLFS